MKKSLAWKHILTAQVFVLAISSSAWADTYTFTTIDVPVPGASIALGTVIGINDAGHIVGGFQDATGQQRMTPSLTLEH